MKCMNNDFRCRYLLFRRIVWCFYSVDTIHLFLLVVISPFDREVMTSPCVCFRVYIICRNTFPTLKLDDPEHTSTSTKTSLSEAKMFVALHNETVLKNSFTLNKTKFNLISL